MHEGHRQRIYNKLKQGNHFYDHEYLEMLLFNAYPRKNTNPIASALLEKFASLGAIFDAEIDELTSVEGVGENVALYLKCVGMCARRASTCDNFGIINNMEDFKKFLSLRFRGKKYEFLEFYLMDKKNGIRRILSYTSDNRQKVMVQPQIIMREITLSNAHAVLVAHNHIDGTSTPSKQDEGFTNQCQIMLSLSGVEFLDHCIYAGDDDVYSYRLDGRLDKIKYEYNVFKMTQKGN
jgi:DNA repair protein RadC